MAALHASFCIFIVCFSLASRESSLPGWWQHRAVVMGKQHCTISGSYENCWFQRSPLVLMFQSSDTEIERSFWSPFTLQFHIRESRSLESSNIVMHFLSKICFSDTNTQYVGKSVFFPLNVLTVLLHAKFMVVVSHLYSDGTGKTQTRFLTDSTASI